MSVENPYNSPQTEVDATWAKSLVVAPAVLLLSTTILSVLLTAVVGFPVAFDTIRYIDHHGAAGLPSMLPVIVGFAVVYASYSLILYGAIQMLKRRRLAMARTAAMLAVIPVLSPLLVFGFPIGIWALVTLTKPEVRKTFEPGAPQE